MIWEYRLTSKNNCIWSLPILLLSVAYIKRKLLKMSYAEERSVHTNLESCNIGLILQLSEFKWTPRSSVLVVFNNVLLLDVTDRSKISSDQKPILPYHFSQTLPLIWNKGLEVNNTDKYLPSCFTWWKSFYYLVKVLLSVVKSFFHLLKTSLIYLVNPLLYPGKRPSFTR